MTILAHNLYPLLAKDLEEFQHITAQRLYEKFIHNDGSIPTKDQKIVVSLKKKRNLPAILAAMNKLNLPQSIG